MFKPMPFEKDERNWGSRSVAYSTNVGAVIAPGPNFELAVLHEGLLVQFSRCSQIGGREGENSTRYCPSYSLRAGVLFAGPPGH